MRASIILSDPSQELLLEGNCSCRGADKQNDRCPNYTFDNYFITPIPREGPGGKVENVSSV